MSFPCDLSEVELSRFAILCPRSSFCTSSRDRLPRIYKALRAGSTEGLIFITRQPFVYIEVLKLLQERLR